MVIRAYIYKDIELIRVENKSKQNIDTLILNITYNIKNITLICVSNSPKINYKDFEKNIIKVIEQEKNNRLT